MSPLLDIEIEIYMCERIAVLPLVQWIKRMNKKTLQSNVQTKKKLAQAIQVVKAVTAENTNLKVQLHIKENLVTALKLKLDDSSNTIHRENDNCSSCNVTTLN